MNLLRTETSEGLGSPFLEFFDLADWSVQDIGGFDFTASRGVAIREFPLKAGVCPLQRRRPAREREASERFRAFGYEELVSGDKANLDILLTPGQEPRRVRGLAAIAAEIAENLQAALEQFGDIHEDLRLSTAE